MTPHGTYSTYANHRCRCESCREAARRMRRARKESVLGRRDEARSRAYTRATAKLRATHDAEFKQLYYAELAKELVT